MAWNLFPTPQSLTTLGLAWNESVYQIPSPANWATNNTIPVPEKNVIFIEQKAAVHLPLFIQRISLMALEWAEKGWGWSGLRRGKN